MPKPVQSNQRYMSGIDGLRAIAVTAVILYHLNFPFASGGLLGVGVFFTLSGYLITDILIAGWGPEGSINLKRFWIRRARRLLPALFVMLGVVTLFVAVFHRAEFASLSSDILPAVLYVSNWWLVFHHVSYFASFGPPSPLGHLWSLAVEEQFYLVWPLLLSILLRFLCRRLSLSLVILALTGVSVTLMAVLYHPGFDPSRVYYGTDTRAFSLLIGSLLAVYWPSRKLKPSLSRSSRIILDSLAVTALLVIIWMMVQITEYSTFLYRGGFVLLAVATAVLVAALAHPASVVGKLLSVPPLRFIGVRSYGIYLWHYPIILLTSAGVAATGTTSGIRVCVQLTATLVIASVSWKWIEEPIRRGFHRERRRDRQRRVALTQASTSSRRNWRKLRLFVIPTTAMVSIYMLAVPIAQTDTAILAGTKAGESPHSAQKQGEGSLRSERHSGTTPLHATHRHPSPLLGVPLSTLATHHRMKVVYHTQLKPIPAGISGTIKPESQRTIHGTSTGPSKPATGSTLQKIQGRNVLAMGDSVMVDAEPFLQKLLPGIQVEASVGKQWYQLPPIIAALKAKDKIPPDVIIETGTNGPFTTSELKDIINSLGPNTHVILVNTRVPRPWQNVVNTRIAQVASNLSNVTVVDWFAASAGKNSYFYPDGVHLNPTGAAYYAKLLVQALYK